ncbi:AMP-binding protein [Breoghania sp.]|uniref:phenylacetate--CoA ligase family protein n=1 Tax=Breoghania sp. TaxID=2065378 RepID=UPI0029C9E730|nr:AMP-binding protein [Breoghania sp.]
MSEKFDTRETRDPQEREADLFRRLPGFLAKAVAAAPGLAAHLENHDVAQVTSREALARLPVLRKPQLMAAQMADPPFGGFAATGRAPERVFLSPGPVWEPQGAGADPWGAARALYAAGFRPGDIVHNSLAYHMTPGGFILDLGARALGCTVFPAGAGMTEMQAQAAAALRPRGWCGTPDYLKAILEKADELGLDCSSIKVAQVSGGALFPSLREDYAARGVAVTQCYATADLGVIAYESEAQQGLILNEDFILEIVRPGTSDPVPDGEVGEIVVTSFNASYPLVRFGTGDMTKVVDGQSPCGRTNTLIAGWMGRADQRTKVKGMFVDPEQVAEVMRRHPEVARARLVVSRADEQDVMNLKIEVPPGVDGLPDAVAATLREVTKLGGTVEAVAPGGLPNDGKVIEDARDYG